MPYRNAIAGPLRLIKINRDGPVPAYTGEVDGHRLVVSLDAGALGKLASNAATAEAIERTLTEKVGTVRAAVQSLLWNGFWHEVDGGIEVHVTALDL